MNIEINGAARQIIPGDMPELAAEDYQYYRIPCIATAGNGLVILGLEGRRGAGTDWSQNDLLFLVSRNGGETFELADRIRQEEYGPGPLSNLVIFAGPDMPEPVVLFCHNYERVFSLRLGPDGAINSAITEITATFEQFRTAYDWNVCATGPGHGLRLRSGRMVVPIWLSNGQGEGGAHARPHRPSVVSTIFSDDGGESWQAGELACSHGDGFDGTVIRNPSETVAYEQADGGVALNIRSESSPWRRLIAESPDGATGWQLKRFQPELFDPVCMASLLADPGQGLAFFVNPDTGDRMAPDGTFTGRRRARLTLKVSTDLGETWPDHRLLHEDTAGYSDLTEVAPGRYLCVFESDLAETSIQSRTLSGIFFTVTIAGEVA